ncbi:amidohydrolase [Marinilabiliaceae bacterium JC017]|nr:amidohydrolase [Marinilabiliaceae bacterium JC017]
MELRKGVQQLAAQYSQEVIEIRRHLHQYPELSFQEYHTSKYIQGKLEEYGIPFRAGYVKTGIVGRIEGRNKDKRVIALRADMDALPIVEEKHLPFRSQNEGVMHACGHDAHSAALLGAAKILSTLKEYWEGTILLIFQPGEEVFPGGAKLMMEEGAFDEVKPELIIGQHVLPNMPVGHVGFKEGMYMASGDEVYLTVKGKGGHGALPHTLNDTVLIASHIIVNLQQIVSRMVPANIPTVLSFGKVIANGATNVIPEKVEIAGTLRTMDEKYRVIIKEKIRKIAQMTAESMDAECEVDIKDGYPVVFNDVEVTRRAKQAAAEYLGDGQVEEMDIRMTAEDFGYYSLKYPTTFYRFGVQQDGGVVGQLHTPGFILNEAALETAFGTLAWLAIRSLE